MKYLIYSHAKAVRAKKLKPIIDLKGMAGKMGVGKGSKLPK